MFYKPAGVNWTDPLYYDVLSDSVWLARQNDGGPVYNYKYYLDTYGRDATKSELQSDFWYRKTENPTAQGGTHLVKWTMLNDAWATPEQQPWLNHTLFGKIGGFPTNFFSFKAIAGMVRAFLCIWLSALGMVSPDR